MIKNVCRQNIWFMCFTSKNGSHVNFFEKFKYVFTLSISEDTCQVVFKCLRLSFLLLLWVESFFFHAYTYICVRFMRYTDFSWWHLQQHTHSGRTSHTQWDVFSNSKSTLSYNVFRTDVSKHFQSDNICPFYNVLSYSYTVYKQCH